MKAHYASRILEDVMTTFVYSCLPHFQVEEKLNRLVDGALLYQDVDLLNAIEELYRLIKLGHIPLHEWTEFKPSYTLEQVRMCHERVFGKKGG